MWHNHIKTHICTLLLTIFLHPSTLAIRIPNYVSTKQHKLYYHYPVPQLQLILPVSRPATQQQFRKQIQQQQQTQSVSHTNVQHYRYYVQRLPLIAPAPRTTTTHQQQAQDTTYLQMHKEQYVQQQQQQHQQQQQQNLQYHSQTAQAVNKYYQQQAQPSHLINSYYQQPIETNNVTKQFASPYLENIAFTAALTKQDYNYGGETSVSGRALHAASSSSSSIEPNNNDLANQGNIDLNDSSINLKLPLKVNTTPIKIAPLPLQAGASFRELANGVTSYGTIYPQRKRR